MSIVRKKGILLPSEFRLAVVTDHLDDWKAFRKFGMNDDVDTGQEEMWPLGTIRTLPTVAAAASVVSDSVADDASPAGTGLWTMLVDGLDADYNAVTEIVQMNGTTPVNTTTSFIRINSLQAITAGSNGNNVGNITVSIGGNPQGYMEAGEGRSHQTGYCVPADKYFVVTLYSILIGNISSATDTIHVQGQVRPFGPDNAWQAISDLYMRELHYSNSETATILPPKMDIRQIITVSGNNNICSSVIGGYLVEKHYIEA